MVFKFRNKEPRRADKPASELDTDFWNMPYPLPELPPTKEMLITREKLTKMCLEMDHAPMQNPVELWWILQRMDYCRPLNSMIELGVCKGGTLRIWAEMMPPGSTIYALDYVNDVNWNYRESDRKIIVLPGDTHDEKTYQMLKKMLNGRKVDFMFQDGAHDPAGVKKDFEWYGSFVRDNGMIAMQDTRLVRSWWDEFTGGGIDAVHPNPNRQETDVFCKEEFKANQGVGVFYKLPNQSVLKFRE